MHNAILPPDPMEELERNRILAEHQQLSRKERRFSRRQQKEKERLQRRRQKKLKKLLWIVVTILIIGGGVSILVWFLITRSPIPESEIISKQGIHWHANLKIEILGQNQNISNNIGIGLVHQPIHTHELDGTIHMEFSSLVKKDNIKLSRFFKIWGKTFNENCIFDKCNGTAGQIKMFVNGEQSFEFENYIMQNKDEIEIIFE